MKLFFKWSLSLRERFYPGAARFYREKGLLSAAG
jgi:hypothetical protein